MATPSVVAPLIAALEGAGAKLLDADKKAIETFFEPLADADANAVVSAIAAHITMNGVAGMVQNPLRNALTGSEPALDQIINSNIAGGLDALESLLSGLANKT